MASKLITQIKEDLIRQLEAKNLTNPYYKDLVDDYCSLWEIKEKLVADIKKRGVSIPWDNGGGQKGSKKNDSLDEFRKTNTQMMNLLKELGLRGADVKPVEEEAKL